ncbi:glycosyltransferase family 4 protein [Mesobacillus maritimus]|uniref:glycosyltransferase family 4 protein n=1 Tax=Mesobacillus maritimus TaxID=1643336 RepID=UPI00384EAC38
MLADITNYLADTGHDVTILMPQQSINEYDIRAKIIYGESVGNLVERDYPYSDLIVSNFFTTVPSAHQASQNGKGLHIRFSLCYEPVFLPEQNKSFHSYYTTPHLITISKYQQELISLLHGIKGQTVPIYINPSFQDKGIRQQNQALQISAVVRAPEGGYAWQRDQDYLLEQLTIVKQQYPHLQINLICPPQEFYHSESLQKLRDENQFRCFTPANDQELCWLYSQSDIFVSSSVYETASLPGLEAMKCGAALATVYSGGNTEYCRHEMNCLLSYRHEKRLASDIVRLIQNPTLRKLLSTQAKQDVEQWTIERSGSIFEQICQSALNQGIK